LETVTEHPRREVDPEREDAGTSLLAVVVGAWPSSPPSNFTTAH